MCAPLLAAVPAIAAAGSATTAATATAITAGTVTGGIAAGGAAGLAAATASAGTTVALTTMGKLVVGSMVASTLTGAAGAGYSMYAQNKASEFQADMAEIQAKDAIVRGKEAELEHLRKVALFRGKQRATLGASGVVVDRGSAYDIVADTTEFGTMDAMTIRKNAKREADMLRSQASAYRSSKGSPLLAAGSTLLTGASQIGHMALSYQYGSI